MRKRTGLTGATVLAVIASTALLLPSPTVAAKKASTPTRGTIAGWNGTDANPLTVAGTQAGPVSAVFTTTEDEQSENVTVWESVGDVEGLWAPAEAVVTGAVEGSPVFAMGSRGASILAWSVDDGIAERRLLVSTRSRVSDAWSPPRTVAIDPSGFDQMPSVGVARQERAVLAYRHDGGAGAVAVTRMWERDRWSDPHTHEGHPGVTQLQVDMSETGHAAFGYDEPDHDAEPGWSTQDVHYRVIAPGEDRWTSAGGYGAEPHVGLVDVEIEQETHAIFKSVMKRPVSYYSSIQRLWRASHDEAVSCPDSTWDCHKQYGYGGRVEEPVERALDSQVNTWINDLGLHTGLGTDRDASVFVSESNLSFWEGDRATVQEGGTSSGIRTSVKDGRLAVGWLQDTEDGPEQRVRTLQGEPRTDRGIVSLGPATNPGEVVVTPSGHTIVVWADPDGTIRSHQLEPNRLVRVVAEYQVGERAAVQWARKKPRRATTYDVRVRKAALRRNLGTYSMWKRRTPVRPRRVTRETKVERSASHPGVVEPTGRDGPVRTAPPSPSTTPRSRRAPGGSASRPRMPTRAAEAPAPRPARP